MSEEGAAYAVLGADIDAIGQAVARWWGLEESVLGMIRRLPPTANVHTPESDDDTLRLVAACANEAVDATALPAAKVQPALQRVVQRYGRLLDLTLRGLQESLHAPGQERIAQTAPMPLDTEGHPVTQSASPGSLRAAATMRSARSPGSTGASR